MPSEISTQASVTILAPADEVWKAVTTPALIKRWFFGVDTETDWRVGSRIVHRHRSRLPHGGRHRHGAPQGRSRRRHVLLLRRELQGSISEAAARIPVAHGDVLKLENLFMWTKFGQPSRRLAPPEAGQDNTGTSEAEPLVHEVRIKADTPYGSEAEPRS